MIMVILSFVVVTAIAAALIARYRWARPAAGTLVPDKHGRTREQSRAVALVTSLSVNRNSIF